MAGSIVGEAWVAVGAQTDKVDEQVVDAFTKAGKKGADAFDDTVSKETKKKSKLGTLGQDFAGSFLGGFSAAIAGPAVVNSLKGFVNAAQESAKIGKLTEQVIKSTGGAAGVTASDVDKLTQSLSKKSGMDDEAIQSGENLLLQFQDIRNGVGEDNKIFDRTSKLMVDMAAKMGVDASTAARTLGKALNEPGQGLTRLRAQGVEFTKEQEKQIDAMNEAGDVAGAQKAILSALEESFGGAAEASATNSERMKVAWENLQEQVGAKLIPVFEKFAVFMVEKVLPVLERFIDKFSEIVKSVAGIFDEFGFNIQSFTFVLQDLFANIAVQLGVSEETITKWQLRIADAMIILGKVIDFVSDHWELFALAIVLIGGPITATIAAIALIIGHFEEFKTAIGGIVDFTKAAVELMQRFWDNWGHFIIDVVDGVFTIIKAEIEGAMKIIQGIIDVFLGLIHGDWDRVWSGLGQIVSGVWTIIQGIVEGAFKILRGIIGAEMKIISGIFDELWEQIKKAPALAFEGMLITIKAFFVTLPKELAGLAFDVGVAIAKAIVDGIGDLGGAIADKAKSGITSIPGKVGGFLNPFGASGGNFVVPRYAGGTKHTSALGLGIVGELGPELVQFGGNAAVFPADQFERQMARALASVLGGNAAGSTVINVMIDNVSHGDAFDVGGRVALGVQRVLADKAINVGVRQGVG